MRGRTCSNWTTASPEVFGPLENLSYTAGDFIDHHGYFGCRNGGLFFGLPTNYQQQFSLQSRPVVPGFFGLDRYVDLTAGYQVSYNWQQNLQQQEQGRTASYNASINAQMNIKLKTLFEPLFEEEAEAAVVAEVLTLPGESWRRTAV